MEFISNIQELQKENSELRQFCNPILDRDIISKSSAYKTNLNLNLIKRQSSKLRRYVKKVPFVNARYTKRDTFSVKNGIYKRVRDWTSGRSLPV